MAKEKNILSKDWSTLEEEIENMNERKGQRKLRLLKSGE